MSTRRDKCAARLGEQRGATLVEFAFIFPIFMTLVLGMFSGGLAYNRKINMTNAAGESSRYGATLAPVALAFGGAPGAPASPPTTGHGLEAWLVRVANAVVQNAGGDLDQSVDGRYVCVAYVHPSVPSPQTAPAWDDEPHRLILTGAGPGLVEHGVKCFDDGRPATERRVQVEVSRNSPINALFFKSDLTLTARSVTRFEAVG